MAKDNSREAKIKLVFASYPEAKSFQFTSDGNAFSLESDAKNHAKNLEDKEVVEITRAMAKSGQVLKTEDRRPETEASPEKNSGAKNEFQAQGKVQESSLNGEPGEGVPYGKDDQGRTVSGIATDVAKKMEASKDRATKDSVTDSSDAKQQEEKEKESVQAPNGDAPATKKAASPAPKKAATKTADDKAAADKAKADKAAADKAKADKASAENEGSTNQKEE